MSRLTVRIDKWTMLFKTAPRSGIPDIDTIMQIQKLKDQLRSKKSEMSWFKLMNQKNKSEDMETDDESQNISENSDGNENKYTNRKLVEQILKHDPKWNNLLNEKFQIYFTNNGINMVYEMEVYYKDNLLHSFIPEDQPAKEMEKKYPEFTFSP